MLLFTLILHDFADNPVPVVSLCVEGGTGVINHACNALSNDIPVVIVNNSGRAASILAMAFKSDGLSRFRIIMFLFFNHRFSTHFVTYLFENNQSKTTFRKKL